jgi:hypothetical protein
LPSQTTKRRSKALRDETQRDDITLSVPIRPEIRDKHESNIPSPESNRQSDDRFVPRFAYHPLECCELVRLQLGRWEGHRELVLGQGLGTE